VRAKFSKESATLLQKIDYYGKIDNLARLSNQALLNIPAFRLMVAPSRPESQRLKLLINYVGIVNSQKVGSYGKPKPFYERPGIGLLLNQLEHLMRAPSESEPLQSSQPSQSPGRTRVIKNGRYTQEFATQVRPSLANDGLEMMQGVNLAPPVVPVRKDRERVFGTKPLRREKSNNAYDDLLSLRSNGNAAPKPANATSFLTKPLASQPLSQTAAQDEENESDSEDVVDVTRSRNGRSPSPMLPQYDSQNDNLVENYLLPEVDEFAIIAKQAEYERRPTESREFSTPSRRQYSTGLPRAALKGDKERSTSSKPQTPSKRATNSTRLDEDVLPEINRSAWQVRICRLFIYDRYLHPR
jgi:hypothetical protein